MSLRFPYLAVPLLGPPPPTLPASATDRWRPLLPIRIANVLTGSFRNINEALADTGADDTIFPLTLAGLLGIILLPELAAGHSVRWSGVVFPIRYGDVRLELYDGMETWSWTARVAFSGAPIRFPLLGQAGFLQYFDATFAGERRVVTLDTNSSFIGTKC